MIREAEFRDCKRITDFLAERHAALGIRRKFVADKVRNMVQVTSQNKALHNCWVVELDGKIEGVLIGATNRIWYSSEREAFDLVYMVSERGRGHGAFLARRFISWARKTNASEITMSSSLGVDARLEKMLERFGMQQVGNVYKLEVKNERSR